MIGPIAAQRRQWLVLMPLAALATIVVAWTVAWYLAARQADSIITAWIEREARAGRIYTCGARQAGGFPFRIEIRCTDPAVELTATDPPLVLKAKELVGVAQIYEPTVIVAEIAGPLSIAESGQSAAWRADWRLAQASLRGIARIPQRLSVVLDDVRLEQTGAGAAEPWAAASHLEFHLKHDPEQERGQPVLDVAIQVGGATLPNGLPLSGKPLDGEVSAILRGISDFRPKPMPVRLKEWQAAGGRLQVSKLRLQQGDAVAVAAGEIGLSAAGRPDGAFDITISGFDRLVQDLLGGRPGGVRLGLIAGISLLGKPAEIDGKRAVAMALRLNDGAMSLGPIPLGKLAPLY